MTDEQNNDSTTREEHRSRTRRLSVLPPATIPEEPSDNSTVAGLINSNPIVEPPPVINTPTSSTASRPRRRSSLSILQALVSSGHLLATHDARKRNFLVGSSRQIPENVMNDLSSSFPNGRALTIMMVTWNTGEAPKLYEQNYTPTARENTRPKEQMLDDISDILLPTFIEYVSDLLIVCTQEMSAAKKRIDWEILLQEVIGPTHVPFHSVHFGTLSLCIFLRRDLIWFCTEPEEDIIKFRAVNPIRTKGSLVITFNLFGTSFMIINSHFEAGDSGEGRSDRRANFHNTTTKLAIPHEFVQRTAQPNRIPNSETLHRNESSTSLDSSPQPGMDMTKSCDVVLWAGDMNFRVDMPWDEVLQHCEKKEYGKILEKDEFHILQQQKSENVYSNFKEAAINFPPTYKYDLREVKKYARHRTPSYTDRILYRDRANSSIECTEYQSVEGITHSDHKPVIAHFRVKLKPGLHTGDLSYGKFNHEVYKRGCEQRERHHSRGVDLRANGSRRAPINRSALCVLQ